MSDMPEQENAATGAMGTRVVAAQDVLDRDTAWVLAMAEALGTNSGIFVPIIPDVDAFRRLFAAVRAAPAAPAQDVGEPLKWHFVGTE